MSVFPYRLEKTENLIWVTDPVDIKLPSGVAPSLYQCPRS